MSVVIRNARVRHQKQPVDIVIEGEKISAVGPKLPASGAALGVLAGLVVIVVGAAVYVGAQAQPDRVVAPKVEGTSGGMAVGRDVTNSTITIGGDRAAK